MREAIRIGIDFDNTIVSYDELIRQIAIERGLVSDRLKANKKLIRDAIRREENGEVEWQKIQGIIYGPRMGEAQITKGVEAFFICCRLHRASVFIISHKTEFARYDPTQTSLRVSALEWMEDAGFFAIDGLGLPRDSVYFEETRRDKVARIQQLECTYFIDDLEEVFLEENFPADVKKILYTPAEADSSLDVWASSSWADIAEYVFDARNC